MNRPRTPAEALAAAKSGGGRFGEREGGRGRGGRGRDQQDLGPSAGPQVGVTCFCVPVRVQGHLSVSVSVHCVGRLTDFNAICLHTNTHKRTCLLCREAEVGQQAEELACLAGAPLLCLAHNLLIYSLTTLFFACCVCF